MEFVSTLNFFTSLSISLSLYLTTAPLVQGPLGLKIKCESSGECSSNSNGKNSAQSNGKISAQSNGESSAQSSGESSAQNSGKSCAQSKSCT